MAKLEPKPGFDWGRVVWSAPDSRIAPICSYCFAGIGEDEVPLMMWKPDGHMAQFCTQCQATWWGFMKIDDEQDG